MYIRTQLVFLHLCHFPPPLIHFEIIVHLSDVHCCRSLHHGYPCRCRLRRRLHRYCSRPAKTAFLTPKNTSLGSNIACSAAVETFGAAYETLVAANERNDRARGNVSIVDTKRIVQAIIVLEKKSELNVANAHALKYLSDLRRLRPPKRGLPSAPNTSKFQRKKNLRLVLAKKYKSQMVV